MTSSDTSWWALCELRWHQKRCAGISRTCLQLASIFALKKTEVSWSKHRLCFSARFLYRCYRRTLYRSCTTSWEAPTSKMLLLHMCMCNLPIVCHTLTLTCVHACIVQNGVLRVADDNILASDFQVWLLASMHFTLHTSTCVYVCASELISYLKQIKMWLYYTLMCLMLPFTQRETQLSSTSQVRISHLTFWPMQGKIAC